MAVVDHRLNDFAKHSLLEETTQRDVTAAGYKISAKTSLIRTTDYTLWVKKHQRSLFCDNFGIRTNFNNSFTVEFCNKRRNKLLYNPPPHLKICCCITLRNLNVQLYNFTRQLFNSKVWQIVYLTINVYRNVMFSIICLCQLIWNITACVQNIRHQHARLSLCIMNATLSVNASLTRCCTFNVRWKPAARTTFLCYWHSSITVFSEKKVTYSYRTGIQKSAPTLTFDLLTSNEMVDQDLPFTIQPPILVMVCLVVFVLECWHNTHTHTHTHTCSEPLNTPRTPSTSAWV